MDFKGFLIFEKGRFVLFGTSAGKMATVFEITKTRFSNSQNAKGFKFITVKEGGGSNAKYVQALTYLYGE